MPTAWRAPLTADTNQLIEHLPRRERQALLACCVPVEMVLSEVIYARDQVAEHVYFPLDAFVSLISQVDDHAGIEVSMVGREGLLGLHLALGHSTTPLCAMVQGAGRALQVSAKVFSQVLLESPALQDLLRRYIVVVMAELAASVACVRFHQIRPRLARWLLMSHDRARRDNFLMTQEFLAYMLGVRRVGVTMAANELARDGLISYHRGHLIVLDRPGLEAASCSCYAAGQQAYEDVLFADVMV